MNHQRSFHSLATAGLILLIASACASPLSDASPMAAETSTISTLGSISGTILLESEDPFLWIYANEVISGEVYSISPQAGARTYTIPDLPAGTYVVVSWFKPMGASGAHTALDTVIAEGGEQVRACEEAVVEIELEPGEEYTGADIGCWGGDFFDLTTPAPSATPLPARVYAPEPEANFALYFTYGACLAETLDTFQGTFSRSMCPPDPPVTISFTLSAEEMRTIYLEMAKIGFFGYPDQFSVVVPEGTVYCQVTPSESYHLKVRNGGVEKDLHWTDDIVEPATQQADQLRAFFKMVIGIIHGRPELKLVPEPSGCGCV
jgi:hypothetical protein